VSLQIDKVFQHLHTEQSNVGANPAKEDKKQYYPKPTKPAQLEILPRLVEPNGNGFLDAGEEGKLILSLKNIGQGDAYQLNISVTPETDISEVGISEVAQIEHLVAGAVENIEIPISATENVLSRQIRLRIDVSEANGFDLDPPAYVTFNTKSLVPPDLTIADFGINDQSGNGKIEPREIVEITARIQNQGEGDAREVTAELQPGENVFITQDSKNSFMLGDIVAGQYKDIVFSVFTNTKASGVPITIALKEKRGRYDKTIPLNLPFNKQQKRSTELVVEGKETPRQSAHEIPSLAIDIEKNIPETKEHNRNAVALIIAISDYANPNIPKVEYAKRDAEVLREYLVKTLGYDEKNILPTNSDELMTFATMRTYIKSKLASYLRNDGSSDLFVYYTGHGAPNTSTNEPFFVPYDCDPNFVSSDNAYNMNEFYADIANLKARSKIVVIDACFSGQDGSGRTLVKNASPALLKVNNALLAGENSVLFQSSSADQVSNWYPEKKHAMFTYFFLKGIQGAADASHVGMITAEQLETYINDPNEGLPYYSNREFQRPQKAVVSGNLKQVIVKLKGE